MTNLCKRTILIDILPFALQLLKELKKVKFKYDNYDFFFDKNGDFVNFYDLNMWEKDGHHRRFQRIGRYHVLDQQIEDLKTFIWLSTDNTTVRQHHTNRDSGLQMSYAGPKSLNGHNTDFTVADTLRSLTINVNLDVLRFLERPGLSVTLVLVLLSQAPESRCSPRCPPGSFKKILNVSCCYNCSLCPVGTYSDAYGMHN